jgi:hypothetical protein
MSQHRGEGVTNDGSGSGGTQACRHQSPTNVTTPRRCVLSISCAPARQSMVPSVTESDESSLVLIDYHCR